MKRRREPKWWVGHSRNITAMIVGIANTVENVNHPDYAGEPSVDEQFRDLARRSTLSRRCVDSEREAAVMGEDATGMELTPTIIKSRTCAVESCNDSE